MQKDALAGLESDDLSATISAPLRTESRVPESYKPVTERIEEPCGKCRGTGQFFGRSGLRLGPCFTCKGSGKLQFKQTREVRAAKRASSANSKAKKIEAFKAEHPAVWAWMDGSDFPPAIEMRAKLEKYGSLFDSSIEFANRMIEKRELARITAIEEKASREIAAQEVNTTALETAFAKAAASNRRTALWIGSVRIKPATKKPGVLYVVDKDAELYLGKVEGGRFVPSRDGREREAEMLKILQDPKAAAIEHGKLTGACAVCSRTLTDADSIAAGIGPICSTKMGW